MSMWKRLSGDLRRHIPEDDPVAPRGPRAKEAARMPARTSVSPAVDETDGFGPPTGMVKHFNLRPSERAMRMKRQPITVSFDENKSPSVGRVVIDESVKYQYMEGFGGSLAYYKNWISEHPNKAEIYDKMFTELRISVLRLRNHYRQQPDQWVTSEEHMNIEREFVTEAYARLSADKPKLLMSSWTPPKELKQNESLRGGGDDAVLKKDEYGQFRYKDFALYWLGALQEYSKLGVEMSYISIQNEPDYNTSGHETCIFDASESYSVPGYYRAFDVTYDVLHRNLDRVPAMIAPETASFDKYINHPYSGSPRIAAQAGHIYNAGDKFDTPDFFSRLATTLRNGVADAEASQTKKVYMTEYANLQTHQRRDPVLLARSIYDTLTVANASMYLNWDLAWGNNTGEGTLLLVDNPFVSESEWTNPKGYFTTQSYEWFKHFCRYVRPGMVRVGAAASAALGSVRILVFRGADSSTTIILLNLEEYPVIASLDGLPPAYADKAYRHFYSTLSEKFTEGTGIDASGRIALQPESITTLYSGPLD